MSKTYLGVDVGGTQIKWVLLNDQGDLLDKGRMPTDDGDTSAGAWKAKISRLMGEMVHRQTSKGAPAPSLGLSAPGLANDKNTMILHMPKRLQGLEGHDWSKTLGMPVTVLNDGHAACLAEYEAHYKPLGIQHFMMLTLGTGVGGGLVLNGKLYQGHLQRAGHLGHATVNMYGAPTMTNMPGSLEDAIGNYSVAQRTEGRFGSTKDLVSAFAQGDEKATQCWLTSVDALAVALASLTNIIAPEVIVLGGGIAAGAGQHLLTPLKKAMASYEWRPGGAKVEIKLAKLGGLAGATGAAHFAKNNLKI
ncbi:ROK family protein [Maribacter sp. 2307ULW6-5]|uniref:ROK family protein n=1 Tax=Maribacter sp. 2307ULW6-5 TaxID=3386275 RepID=UPI0039BC8AB7